MSLESIILLLLIALIAGAIVVVGIFFLRKQGDLGDQKEAEIIRLLVVDSDANARETLSKFLRFEKTLEIVGVASSGKAAIETAKQATPTVILLDVSLPDMDGLAVAEAITREMPGMRFVFIRGFSVGEPENWHPGLSRPLEKPLDYRELVDAIKLARRYV